MSKIVLYINFYIDRNQKRQEELEHCLTMNAQSLFIDNIYAVVDNLSQYTFWTTRFPKIKLFYKAERPTFQDFFNIANQTQIYENQINILSNTDIIFTDSIEKLKTFNMNRIFICLSRNDCMISGSQDSWIWTNHIHISQHANFYLGVPACDHSIAYAALQSGYKLHNPAKTIQTIHVHSSEVRNYNQSNRLTGPGYTIPITELGAFENPSLINQSNNRKRSRSRSRSRQMVVSRSRSPQRSPQRINYKSRSRTPVRHVQRRVSPLRIATSRTFRFRRNNSRKGFRKLRRK